MTPGRHSRLSPARAARARDRRCSSRVDRRSRCSRARAGRAAASALRQGASPTRRTACALPARRRAGARIRACARRDAAARRPPLLPQEHRDQSRRRRAAGAGQGRDREQRRAASRPARTRARATTVAFEQIGVNVQFFATTPALQKILLAIETHQPYLVVDNITVRPLNAFRGFKPAPGQEPELNVQLDVGGWAYAEPAKRATARRRRLPDACEFRMRRRHRGSAMNDVSGLLAAWLVWLMPFAVVALALGFETDWGRAVAHAAAARRPRQRRSRSRVALAARIPDRRRRRRAQRETVERTLFNPTRRPAPPASQAAGRNRRCSGASLHADRARPSSATSRPRSCAR